MGASIRTIISAHARIAGIAGWPVAHSRSPRLHNVWLQRHGIDGAYIPLPIAPGRFADTIRGLQACGFTGLNVTIPHKEVAFALCDEIDDFARRVGAVNTIVFEDDRIIGRNTDGFGFIVNLRAHGVPPAAGPALVLGAGGSARAVVAALRDEGAEVTICARQIEKSRSLARTISGPRVLDWHDRAAAVADYALVVNATPIGMRGPDDPASPIDLSAANPKLVVADLVYVPQQTKLLRDAEVRGLITVGGLGMLLHQARPGFAAWFGVMPEIDQELIDLIASDIPEY